MQTSRKLVIVSFFAVLSLLAIGCNKKPADQSNSAKDQKVAATVNGTAILEPEFDSYLQMRQQQVGPSADKEKERKDALNEMIDKISSRTRFKTLLTSGS